MEYTQEMRDSEDIRNNKLYKKTLDSMMFDYRLHLETNPADNHLGYVQAQASLKALRILNEKLLAASVIRD